MWCYVYRDTFHGGCVVGWDNHEYNDKTQMENKNV